MTTKLKIIILFMFCSLLIVHYNYGQYIIDSHDPNWFILAQQGKSAGAFSGNQWPYNMTSNVSNSFKILDQNAIETTMGNQNMFIITSDGNFVLEKYSDLHRPANNSYHFKTPGSTVPFYMSFMIRYEDDNPPAKQIINEPNGPIILIPSRTDSIRLSNKLYKGSDVTLIISKEKLPCKNAVVKYDYNIFSLSKVFDSSLAINGNNSTLNFNKNSYCFPYSSVGISTPGRLVLNDIYSAPYYYINFYVNNIQSIGEVIEFKCDCADETFMGKGYTIKDTINEPDDPNYIELLSINKDGNDYWASYHVECYNNGKAIATNIGINLELPNSVDGNSAELLDWRAGGYQGADSRVDFNKGSNNKIGIDYLSGRHVLDYHSSGEILERHKAWFEFRVKINSTDENQIVTMDLKPKNPITRFDTKTFAIVKYIDGCRETLMGNPNDCKKITIKDVDEGLRPYCCNAKWCWILLGICILLLALYFFFRRR